MLFKTQEALPPSAEKQGLFESPDFGDKKKNKPKFNLNLEKLNSAP